MEIRYTDEALADLARLPKNIANQATRKVARLEAGLVGDIKPLKSFPIGFRLRSGDYRILFDIENECVVVQRVLHRRQSL